jgi:CheY-like chemotaxis protein
MTYSAPSLLTVPVESDSAPSRERLTGRPFILLVDDDPGIRHVIRLVLNSTTVASVMEAADPQTAVSRARHSGRPVDLLITDIHLRSAKTGIDLACGILLTNPAMKVLLMSASDPPQCDLPPGWQFLSKPFQVSVLVDWVNVLCGCAGLRRTAGN